MRRSDIVSTIAKKNPTVSHKETKLIVDMLINKLSVHLASGGRIELRGFGTFRPKELKTRVGHNPRTGEKITLKQKSAVHFKPGAVLRAKVDNKKIPK